MHAQAPSWMSRAGRRLARPARSLLPVALVAGTAVAVGAAAASVPEAPPLPGRLVYSRAAANVWDLFASDVNGANELRLSNTRDANPVGEDQPRWSPDGREIAFTTLAKNGERSFIWRIPFDGGTPTPIATADAEGTGFPAWHPGGETIVFAGKHDGGGASVTDLKVWSATGARTLLASADRDEREPDWSPDGGRIVYSARAAGDDEAWWSLRVIDADGANDRVLWAQAGATARNPRWSPDGRSVAFVTYPNVDGYGRGDLMILDAASGQAESLVGGVANPAAWSPDGEWLLVYNTKENGLEPVGQPTPTRDPGVTQMLGLYLVRVADRAVYRLTGAAGGAAAKAGGFEWGQVSDWTRGTYTPTSDSPPTATPTATVEATSTSTPTQTSEATPTLSPTPPASPTVSPTPSATPQPTTPVPTATETPPPDPRIYLAVVLNTYTLNGNGTTSRPR